MNSHKLSLTRYTGIIKKLAISKLSAELCREQYSRILENKAANRAEKLPSVTINVSKASKTNGTHSSKILGATFNFCKTNAFKTGARLLRVRTNAVSVSF